MLSVPGLTHAERGVYTAAASAKSLQSCLTLCDPMDCSLPGSSVHGTLQARVLEWGLWSLVFHYTGCCRDKHLTLIHPTTFGVYNFFYHGRESFPETATDLSFCLIGQKKWVKCQLKTNQCQRALDCHFWFRLILLHLLELGAGSPLLSPRLPTRCVHSNTVIHVCKVGT